MYGRWFAALEIRLTILADELYALDRAGTESGSHPALVRRRATASTTTTAPVRPVATSPPTGAARAPTTIASATTARH
jgi:hypothetical protein